MLRSSPLDLKIILKWKDNDDTTRCLRKEYQVYSQNLAHLSKYVDGELAKSSVAGVREIVLHDVSPTTFELGLKFEMDSVAIRSMTPEDVLLVVDFYHDFGFTEGLRLCDAVVLEYFLKHLDHGPLTPPDDLDLLVQLALVAYRLNLPNAKDYAIQYLQSKLQRPSRQGPASSTTVSPFGATMFSVDHIKALHPLFKKGIISYYNNHSNKSNNHHSLNKDQSFSQEEIDSPLFPRFFVSLVHHDYAALQYHHHHPNKTLYLQGTQSISDTKLTWEVDGYYPDKFEKGDGTKTLQLPLGIKKSRLCQYDWAIVNSSYDEDTGVGGGNDDDDDDDDSNNSHDSSSVGNKEDNIVYWKCPYSRSLDTPPTEPWIPVHDVAIGKKPQVRYQE